EERDKTILRERVRAEMHQAMVETGTGICQNIDDVRRELFELRGELAALARKGGLRIIAASTHPFSDWKTQEITQHERYKVLVEDLQDVARANLIFGLHVHVGIKDREVAMALANQVRYFLPHLLSLTTSSPFWLGRNTGLKSVRCEIFKRFPRTGIPDAFDSYRSFEDFVDLLVKTNCIDNGKKIWWDVRVHQFFDTVEIRVCDMPTNIEHTIAIVALVQALYASNDLAGTAREILPLISADEAAGRTPNEEQLKLLAFSQLKTGDEAGYAQTLERLVTHHPRTEYWADLVSRISRRAGFADRLQVDALRLARRVGALEDQAEYIDLAQLALQAGVPGEAQAVVDEGFAKGVLGKGAQAERHQRLKAGADKAVADDKAALVSSEDSARKARDGAALVAMGQALATYGQPDKGLALMAEGQAKGVLKHPDDARLRHGVALLAAGQRAAAEAQFKAITATDGAADLARLWLLVR
ncbi:MAG: YbdK family carboxylate-amine ligase, partial [Burkholderiales bacterium]|nr:YbdK family carboxylate-amine ligase [Burkholderiales bacterium]